MKVLNTNTSNLNSVSSVHIPQNFTRFNTLQPTVRLKQLNLGSASSFHVPSLSLSSCFHNGPRVILSPLRSSIIRKTRVNNLSDRRRCRVYPKINKCNTKNCSCCRHLSVDSTIKSKFNGRVFNVQLDKDLDCHSSHIIYVIT